MGYNVIREFQEARNNILKWRNRYSKFDYPYKIVVNIFYRQYAMKNIWQTEIDSSFGIKGNTETDFASAYEKLAIAYSDSALRINSQVEHIMTKKEWVGGLNYVQNIPKIEAIRNGDEKEKEELEFTYIYYLLSNKVLLMWAALGRLGRSRDQAFSELLDLKYPIEKYEYDNTLGLIGELSMSRYLSRLYTPIE